jgi:hypothetical protein
LFASALVFGDERAQKGTNNTRKFYSQFASLLGSDMTLYKESFDWQKGIWFGLFILCSIFDYAMLRPLEIPHRSGYINLQKVATMKTAQGAASIECNRAIIESAPALQISPHIIVTSLATRNWAW